MTDNVIRTWNYHIYEVRVFLSGCGYVFRGYFRGQDLRFLISNGGNNASTIFDYVYFVAAIDNKGKIHSIKKINKEASLLKEKTAYEIIGIGTVKALARNFPESAIAQVLESFVRRAQPQYLLFGRHLEFEKTKQFMMRHKKEIRANILDKNMKQPIIS